MQEPLLGQQATGITPPRNFILDATVLEYKQEHQILREDIKQNKIIFAFPSGMNQLDLKEECRALAMLDDFDMMFDIVMQMLVDRDVVVIARNDAGAEAELASFHVTDRYQDLRGIDFINDYPIVVSWLVEFVGAAMLRKYPQLPEAPAPVEDQKKAVKKTVYKAS